MPIHITTSYRRARPSTMSEMDFPDSHEHEIDKWKVENCFDSSSKSSSTLETTIDNAEDTGKCDLDSWMLTNSQPDSSMEITDGCNPDAWTSVHPVQSTLQADLTNLQTTVCSGYQQTTNSPLMVTTQLCWHCAINKNLNTVRADSCTCTCKCCS